MLGDRNSEESSLPPIDERLSCNILQYPALQAVHLGRFGPRVPVRATFQVKTMEFGRCLYDFLKWHGIPWLTYPTSLKLGPPLWLALLFTLGKGGINYIMVSEDYVRPLRTAHRLHPHLHPSYSHLRHSKISSVRGCPMRVHPLLMSLLVPLPSMHLRIPPAAAV